LHLSVELSRFKKFKKFKRLKKFKRFRKFILTGALTET
jgi:hypothetical protein